MMTLQAAALMADYNRWMNAQLYDAAAQLSPDELAADRKAFFGSILGTLNHIAVADTIWLRRFAQHPARFQALRPMLDDFAQPPSLRHTLHEDLASLRAYRVRVDGIIVAWVAEVQPEHLASDFAYASMAGVVSTRNFGALVQHFFNHQTHHRGQASTLLFQAGVDVGVTDLLAVIPKREG